MREQGKLILIVDDEPDMCWALEHLLKNHGFATRKAQSAREALELMGRHRVACAFLDAKLPDMDGLELARHIQEIAPDIGIVMVSGYFYRDDVSIQEAISQGLIRSFISKPFLREEILKALRP
ncbi:MAG: response regulator [Deltaproteobacteria bacterium]|nr:response regulator [Deltaproteobacteria bacterium]